MPRNLLASMPCSWNFQESLVNVLQILMARAMSSIPQSKKAELANDREFSNLIESEKDHADAYSNKMFRILKLQRELEKILNDVERKRREIEDLEEECITASRRLFDIQHTILERIEVLHEDSEGVMGRPRSPAQFSQAPSGWLRFGLGKTR